MFQTVRVYALDVVIAIIIVQKLARYDSCCGITPVL